MFVEISESESAYLARLLDEAHTELLHGLHRADSLEFRRLLRDNVDLNERLRRKVAAESTEAVLAG